MSTSTSAMENHTGDTPCSEYVRIYVEKFGEEEARQYFEVDDLNDLPDDGH